MLSRPKLVAEAFLRGLPPLSSAWLRAIDDGSAELRLAVAIATAHDPSRRLGPIRVHAMPLDAKKQLRDLAKNADGLVQNARVVWQHRDLVDDLGAIALLRARESDGHLYPLTSPVPAWLADVASFVEGSLDTAKMLGLARGLMTLQTSELEPVPERRSAHALAAHALVRLAYPTAVAGEIDRHASPLALRQLLAGRFDAATTTLSRALAARGVRMKLSRLCGSVAFAQRLAASVAIPISPSGHRELFRLVAKSSDYHPESEAR
jgi:CRISPR-associated protein Csx17